MKISAYLQRCKDDIEDTSIKVEFTDSKEPCQVDGEGELTKEELVEVLHLINNELPLYDYCDIDDVKPHIASAFHALQKTRNRFQNIQDVNICTQDNQLICQLLALFKAFIAKSLERDTSLEIHNVLHTSKWSKDGMLSRLGPQFINMNAYNIAYFDINDTEQYVGNKVLSSPNAFVLESPPEVKDHFRKILDTHEISLQTRKLLAQKDLHPQAIVEVGEQVFFVSQVFDASNGATAFESVLYTVDNGEVVSRLCWYSYYMGAWYTTDEFTVQIYRDKKQDKFVQHPIYKKGSGLSYTQEMKCCVELERCLQSQMKPVEELEKRQPAIQFEHCEMRDPEFSMDPDFVNNVVLESQQKHSCLSKQVRRHKVSQAFKEPRKYRPGSSFGEGRMNARIPYVIKQSNKIPKEVIPDFSQKYVYQLTDVPHLTGRTTVEAFEVLYRGNTLVWEMQYNEEGMVWVRHIYDKNSPVNSFGVHCDVVDSGSITNKPFEYLQQGDTLAKRKNLPTQSDRELDFVDISSVLDQLIPIKKFRKQRSISRD